MKKACFAIAVVSFILSVSLARSESSSEPKLVGGSLSLEDFLVPPVAYRPFVRWWWPGNDVEEDELKREVHLLADHGFGGAEIQSFGCGLNLKADKEEMGRRLAFDTKSYYDNLSVVLEEAKARGLTIDLTLGSGWPTGGAHIAINQGMKTLLWEDRTVTGPGPVSFKLRAPNVSPSLLARLVTKFTIPRATEPSYEEIRPELFLVIAARVSEESRGNEKGHFLDPSSLKVITDRVAADGRLSWEAPEGKWKIISVYLTSDGMPVKLCAQSKTGYVIDHFDPELVKFNMEHLLGPRTGLPEYHGAPIRAFFNDSFEFETPLFFTPDFFAEFERRRGYGLTPFLPAALRAKGWMSGFLGPQTPPYLLTTEDERIRYDYELTVSDLFIERFIDTSSRWAAEHGLLSRVQAYGFDLDVIRAAGHADLPETEQLYAGGAEMFLKIASSGAHLYNRPVVSAESLVWIYRDYMTTPLKMKAAADKLFTSGINQMIYHGFPYRKDDQYGETGWHPFSSPYIFVMSFSSNISEANPFWAVIPRLNSYVARCQYVLRQGQPETDVLVYYPWLGFPDAFSNVSDHEPLFNGIMPDEKPGKIEAVPSYLRPVMRLAWENDPRIKWLSSTRSLLKELEGQGFSWEWVNDESLCAGHAADGKIEVRGHLYKAVLIINTEAIQPETATRLAELAKEGAAVVVVGEPPAKQPGFHNYEQGDLAVQAAFAQISSAPRGMNAVSASEVIDAFHRLTVRPGISYSGVSSPLRHIRRRLLTGGQVIFLRNPTNEEQKDHLFVTGGCPNAQWLDAWTGKRYAAIKDARESILVELPAYGSMILACGDCGPEPPEQTLESWPQDLAVSREVPLDSWTLTVSGDDVPAGNFSRALKGLSDWREIKELQYCSTPGRYETKVEIEVLAQNRIYLDLGRVHYVAEVSINGQHAGTLLIPPFRLDVTDRLVPGVNHVEVKVVPPLINRLIGKARRGDRYYRQFLGRGDSLLPAGLIGPTKLLFTEK